MAPKFRQRLLAGESRLPAMVDRTLDDRTPHRIHFHQDYRPMWLQHVRIYEKAPALMVPEAMDILLDALRLGDVSSADAVIREYGIVGQWRPSAVIVSSIIAEHSNRFLASNCVAHALWNVDLRTRVGPNSSVVCWLDNDESRDRIVRIHLICTELTDEELEAERDRPRPF